MKKLLALLFTMAMLCSFAITASASDFNFYGSLRFQTFSDDVSKEATGAGVSDQDTKWGTLGTSRLGAKIKLSDKITGMFELGVGDENLTVRLFFGEYNFGAGKILIGQSGHPMGESFSSRVGMDDSGLLKYGVFYGGLVEMIKLTFGGFQLYFIEPNINADNDAWLDADTKLPQFAASYDLKYENFTFDITGAYQSYEVENHNNNTSFDVNSYLIRTGLKGEFGPLMLGATFGWGENTSQIGSSAIARPAAYTSDTENTIDSMGYTFVGAYKATDNLRFEAGYGYIKSEINAIGAEDDACSYYLQAGITIAPGFVVTPEIGRVDYKSKQGIDEGDMTYFGAKWQIDF
ncbi:MAG: hypothetical protein JRJ44_01835 [Deltaproteobacteria bacterium]|nr:hypothetical protein [Deltaproteobacteria bacterium]